MDVRSNISLNLHVIQLQMDDTFARRKVRNNLGYLCNQESLKNELRPHHNNHWYIPSKDDARFIACMKDVLNVYDLPYNPQRPAMCMDEKPSLKGDAREPLPKRPGDNQKKDSKYTRNGTYNILFFINPLFETHHVSVHEHRTAFDRAKKSKYLVNDMYPDIEKIILVIGNLNTHKPFSLYKRYSAAKARRIIRRLELHYTPKHES